MGVDCYGLNPVIKEGSSKPKEPKDFGTLTEKDQKAYLEAESKYENENRGVYFRTSWWYWRPMWKFVYLKCNGLVGEKLYKEGMHNSGTVSQKDSIEISKILLNLDTINEARKLEEDYKIEMKPKLKFNELINKAQWVFFNEIVKPQKYPNKKNLVPGDLKELDSNLYETWNVFNDLEYNECNYPFDVNNLKEFGEFCSLSDGFTIN